MNQSEWIVDRRPTAEDADADGDVLVPVPQGIFTENWKRVSDGDPWMPCPPPYEPPKPKRWKGWCDLALDCDGETHDFDPSKLLVEWMPGDPPDLDEFLRLADDLMRRVQVFVDNNSRSSISFALALQKLKQARGGE